MKRNPLSFLLLAAFAAGGVHAAGNDAEALATLTAVNDHEVKSAELARSKGVDGDVAKYAEMMVKEHGANQAQTQQLASSAALTPAETDAVKALKTKSQAERDALSTLSGDAFEAAYVDAMVKDHAEVLAKLDKELIPNAANAANAAVKAHLQKTREHVAHHLEQAKALDAQATAAADGDAD